MFCYVFVDVVEIMTRSAPCTFNNQVTSCFGLKLKQKETVGCVSQAWFFDLKRGQIVMASPKTARILDS